jgi:type IV secretory pathway VirB10-like protein
MGEEPGADELGGTGAGGSVNSHLGKLFGQAILYTALNAVGQSLSRALYDSASVTQTFSDRQPQIKPTIYISPASRFDINVVRDLPLDRYEVRQ